MSEKPQAQAEGNRPKPKPPKPDHVGPKERELAVTLTAAILKAAPKGNNIREVERTATEIYERMLAVVAAPERAPIHASDA